MTKHEDSIAELLLTDITNNTGQQNRRLAVDAYEAFAKASLLMAQAEQVRTSTMMALKGVADKDS